MNRSSWSLICFLLGAALGLYSATAQAGCGASYCPLNTRWDIQGVWQNPGLRMDLRYEYLDQDKLRYGRDRVSVGEIPEHHDEIETVNRNVLLELGYNFGERFGLALTLPYLTREHQHIHNHHGVQLPEEWRLEGIGDVRLVGSYRLRDKPVTLLAGLKLPTGETDEANGSGDTAERSLQRGTGTTDAIVGLGWEYARGGSAWSWFAQGTLQEPLSSHDKYQPGRRLSVDGGFRYVVTGRLAWLGQLNLVVADRDEGDEAEPGSTGGEHLYLSPGLSYAVSNRSQLYLFVQQALYHRVNGVQLVTDQAFAGGFSMRF